MSDYARANTGGATHFTDKDALSSGDSNKVIVGADYDAEYQAIVTAVATKYDVTDLASEVVAEALTSNAHLLTPLRLDNVFKDNGGMISDIQALADPGADRLLGWDDSGNAAIAFTAGTGLAFTTTSFGLSHLGIENLTDPGADRIYFWDDGAGNTAFLTANTGLSITGTNLNLDHLGIQDLTDPGADRIYYWDDSATATNFLTVDNGLTIDADDTMGLTDVAAGVAQPVVLTSGAFTFDLSSITEITGPNLSQSADGFLINDAGVLKVMPIDQAGIPMVTLDAAQTFAITDANTMQVLTGTTNRVWTIPPNSSVAFEIGSFIIVQDSGTGDLLITAGTGVILDSVFHAAAATAQSDRVQDGGRAVLIKTATDTWSLGGDIANS